MASRNVHTISDMKRNPKGFDIEDSDSDEEIVVSYEKERRLRSPRRFRKSNVWVPAEKRSQYGSSGNSGTFLTAFVAAIIVVVIFVLIAGSLILLQFISPSIFGYFNILPKSDGYTEVTMYATAEVSKALEEVRQEWSTKFENLVRRIDIDESVSDIQKSAQEQISKVNAKIDSLISNSETRLRRELDNSFVEYNEAVNELTSSISLIRQAIVNIESFAEENDLDIAKLAEEIAKVEALFDNLQDGVQAQFGEFAKDRISFSDEIEQMDGGIQKKIQSAVSPINKKNSDQYLQIERMEEEMRRMRKSILQLSGSGTDGETKGYFTSSLVRSYPNSAASSLGAIVIHSTSQTYGDSMLGRIADAIGVLFDKPTSSRSKQLILKPSDSAGECWPMQGSSGNITIQLAFKTQPLFVGFAEVPLNQRASKDSSPREFCVYAEGSAELGCFEHDPTKGSPQLFNIELEDTRGYEFVKIEIRNNWGNSEYTCLYMFLVLGDKV